jgi:nucleoside-diphosphate-sugar epimerase
MDTECSEILLIGGTGYVGQQLAKEALARGMPLVALCENDRSFMLQSLGVRTLTATDCAHLRFSKIINLAYPTRGADYTHSCQNQILANTIWQLAAPQCTVVHASTVAVFGADMEFPQHLGLLKPRREHAYVESKIEMEWLLARHRPITVGLDIVRLGNVWGPGSPLWTAGLIQRMLEDEPVGVRGVAGISNATDVANVVDYLLWLVRRPLSAGMRFHHLAELASVSWNELIAPLATELHLQPRLLDYRPMLPLTLRGEARAAFQMIPFGGIARYIAFSRRAASYVRSILRSMPASIQQRIDQAAREKHGREQRGGLSVGDAGLLRLLSCSVRFDTVVDPDWTPAVSYELSLERVKSWMRRVGYISEYEI